MVAKQQCSFRRHQFVFGSVQHTGCEWRDVYPRCVEPLRCHLQFEFRCQRDRRGAHFYFAALQSHGSARHESDDDWVGLWLASHRVSMAMQWRQRAERHQRTSPGSNQFASDQHRLLLFGGRPTLWAQMPRPMPIWPWWTPIISVLPSTPQIWFGNPLPPGRGSGEIKTTHDGVAAAGKPKPGSQKCLRRKSIDRPSCKGQGQ